MANESQNSDRDKRPEDISKYRLELPVLGAVSIDRRQALKVWQSQLQLRLWFHVSLAKKLLKS